MIPAGGSGRVWRTRVSVPKGWIRSHESDQFNKENSFHGQEIKGYYYSTSAIIVQGNSPRTEEVKEERLTSIAYGFLTDGQSPNESGISDSPQGIRLNYPLYRNTMKSGNVY
jgi:hypothetical protein